ncbi:MAG TPA: hypothetical protein VJO14_07215 [Bacteroidota bacterium]|nr:hypothetical protein [Bacteroidota bacterium]
MDFLHKIVAAVRSADPGTVRELLKRGTGGHLSTDRDETPLDIARGRNRHDIEKHPG